jgi:hypothetical protein
MDNASNNMAFLEELEIILKARDITFNATDAKIMCFSHCVNLFAKAVITSLSPDDSDDKRDPLLCCRETIKKIRGSDTRRQDFRAVINDGNQRNLFYIKGRAVQIPQNELLLDVKTRWDSTYKMLRRFLDMRPVSSAFSCSLNPCSQTPTGD